MPAAIASPRPYVSLARTMAELCCDDTTVYRLVAEGKLGTLEPIGPSRRKYCWQDIQRLKAAAIRPATA